MEKLERGGEDELFEMCLPGNLPDWVQQPPVGTVAFHKPHDVLRQEWAEWTANLASKEAVLSKARGVSGAAVLAAFGRLVRYLDDELVLPDWDVKDHHYAEDMRAVECALWLMPLLPGNLPTDKTRLFDLLSQALRVLRRVADRGGVLEAPGGEREPYYLSVELAEHGDLAAIIPIIPELGRIGDALLESALDEGAAETSSDEAPKAVQTAPVDSRPKPPPLVGWKAIFAALGEGWGYSPSEARRWGRAWRTPGCPIIFSKRGRRPQVDKKELLEWVAAQQAILNRREQERRDRKLSAEMTHREGRVEMSSEIGGRVKHRT